MIILTKIITTLQLLLSICIAFDKTLLIRHDVHKMEISFELLLKYIPNVGGKIEK